MNVAIVQPSLAKYRAPFYRGLTQRLGPGVVVHYSVSSKIASVEPDGFMAQRHSVRELSIGGASIIWQPFELALSRDPAVDVIVFSWNARDVLLGRAMRSARRRGKGVALWGHGYSKRESTFRLRVRRRLARLADVVILYDEQTRRDLAAAAPALGDKLAVAPNAIDQTPIQSAKRAWTIAPNRLARFRQERAIEGRRVLLFVSRLYAENRLDLLIDAMPIIQKGAPQALAVIIGEGPDRSRLERLANERGLEDAVRFLGAIYDESAIAPWFLAADAFVYPRNIGLSLLHAFGYGLPVVTADASKAQNPEFVAFRPERNGLTYRDGDARDLARMILRLLQEEPLRQQLAKEAEMTATRDFSMSAMVEGYAQALIRCAESAKRRRSRSQI